LGVFKGGKAPKLNYGQVKPTGLNNRVGGIRKLKIYLFFSLKKSKALKYGLGVLKAIYTLKF